MHVLIQSKHRMVISQAEEPLDQHFECAFLLTMWAHLQLWIRSIRSNRKQRSE